MKTKAIKDLELAYTIATSSSVDEVLDNLERKAIEVWQNDVPLVSTDKDPD